MILRRCEKGHYYDGEIYEECPQCSGAAQAPQMYGAGSTDYADEDSVTVALPRMQGRGRQPGAGIPDEDPATAALPRRAGNDAGMAHRTAGDAGAVRRAAGNAGAVHHAAGNAGAVHRAAGHAGVPRKQGLKPVVGWLVCVRGNDFGSSFTIRLGRNFIGRSEEMEIALHGDESIAMEKHAAIYYVPKQRRFAVEPGTSGKQFYLNRQAVIRPVWIKQHDILSLGNTSLMFFPCCGEHFSWEELIRKRREREQNR